jgi:predicted PurR-regulated permease PerM
MKLSFSKILILLIIVGFSSIFILHLDFFLIVFSGIFLGVILNYFSRILQSKTKLKYSSAFSIVIVSFLSLNIGLSLIIGASLDSQIYDLIENFPQMLDNLKSQLGKSNFGIQVLNEIPNDPSSFFKKNKETTFKVINSFYSSISSVSNIVIILFIGIYLASSPSSYTNGFVKLFPVTYRLRVIEILEKIRKTLSMWMLAKLTSMLIVGILTFIGLEILNIPYSYALALIAALCSFIPYLGPYIAFIPAILVASMRGFDSAMYLAFVYVLIQAIEGYLVTPYIEKKFVSLPPALTLVWMLFIGIITGFFGLIIATPILAMLLVIVKEVYVKDYLEREI